MKRGPTTRMVVGREAQVDLCLSEGGMVVSFGRTSFWLERAEAEDLVETMERALLLWSKQGTANDASPDGGATAVRRANAAS